MMIIILFYSCLFLDEEYTSQICLDPENDKSLWKRDFEKRILYVVRIKIRLNLIRYMNFAINSKLMQDWTVKKAKLSWNIDPFR